MSAHLRSLLIVILALVLLGKCGTPGCAGDVEGWIDEAPDVLKEFQAVQAEVLADHFLVRKRDTLGRLFVWPRDTVRSDRTELPKLRAWFRAGRGFLKIAEDHCSARYRVCDGWGYWAQAVLSQGRPKTSHEVAAQMRDTMDLGGGWYAWVTSCEDCWD